MSNRTEHDKTPDLWEDGTLGTAEEYVQVVTDVDENAIDEALELKPISIRLQAWLIEDFKRIAEIHGVGYQPLMRQVLTRFVEAEKKRILRQHASEITENSEGHDGDEDCEDEARMAL